MIGGYRMAAFSWCDCRGDLFSLDKNRFDKQIWCCPGVQYMQNGATVLCFKPGIILEPSYNRTVFSFPAAGNHPLQLEECKYWGVIIWPLLLSLQMIAQSVMLHDKCQNLSHSSCVQHKLQEDASGQTWISETNYPESLTAYCNNKTPQEAAKTTLTYQNIGLEGNTQSRPLTLVYIGLVSLLAYLEETSLPLRLELYEATALFPVALLSFPLIFSPQSFPQVSLDPAVIVSIDFRLHCFAESRWCR